MAYHTLQPPFTLKFDEMSKKELRNYFQWFQSVMPERIMELANAVQASPGFEKWVPDYTPESLVSLGKWLSKNLETRSRTPEEFAEINTKSPYQSISSVAPTNKAFSVAVDTGMYLSQVFLKNHPSLKWDQPLKGSKRFIDYGQPVLVGFGVVPFNPVRMTVTLMDGLVEGSRTDEGLRKIYDNWSKKVPQ
jgi:hypothetical protein